MVSAQAKGAAPAGMQPLTMAGRTKGVRERAAGRAQKAE